MLEVGGKLIKFKVALDFILTFEHEDPVNSIVADILDSRVKE